MNIYIGNLPKTATEESIRQIFEGYGEVTQVKLLKDQYSGELRGFGFIEMPSKSEAQSAIEGINGTDLEGNKLTVNEARSRSDRSGGRRRGGGYQGRRSRSW